MSDVANDVGKIIEEKEQKMYSKLHSTGKYVFDIFNMANKLKEKFPRQINFQPYPIIGYTFKGSNFSCYVERNLPESISLSYEGDYSFIFKEKLQENDTYKVHVYNIDGTVTADIIQNSIVNVHKELMKLQIKADTIIKDIETELENM